MPHHEHPLLPPIQLQPWQWHSHHSTHSTGLLLLPRAGFLFQQQKCTLLPAWNTALLPLKSNTFPAENTLITLPKHQPHETYNFYTIFWRFLPLFTRFHARQRGVNFFRYRSDQRTRTKCENRPSVVESVVCCGDYECESEITLYEGNRRRLVAFLLMLDDGRWWRTTVRIMTHTLNYFHTLRWIGYPSYYTAEHPA